jgi:hypothetical protein
MSWLKRQWWWWVLVTGAITAVVLLVAINLTARTRAGYTNASLARALGDTGGSFATPWITCRARRGSTGTETYNRRCLRIDIYGLCSPGTGEVRTAIFVRVRRHGYDVVDEKTVWVSPPCASVA